MLSEDEVKHILGIFPDVSFAFAYGSGVVRQDGYEYSSSSEGSKSLPMIDLILVVEDAAAWHSANILRNPSHYSCLMPVKASYIASFQDLIKANVWFNPSIPVGFPHNPLRQMKYGVISRHYMLRDLTQWNSLYVAGRLHKPVHIIKHNPEIELFMGLNREQALRTSLLLLPERFNEADLFMAVASLSYVGDPRMLIGENPKKVNVNLHITASFNAAVLHCLYCIVLKGPQLSNAGVGPLSQSVPVYSGRLHQFTQFGTDEFFQPHPYVCSGYIQVRKVEIN